ncbi:MAG: SpoIID/LytB domain-containing protein [Synechococcaceae cyanobacterium SM2_3_1]|nr:SpoIID/LytB domain-containing protein [Synechococcaceae cyanobacterium SM2_3_1]
MTLAGSSYPDGIWELRGQPDWIHLLGPGPPQRFSEGIWIDRCQGIELPQQAPRRYRGRIWVQVGRQGQLLLINWIPLEDYLLSVVPGEMPPEWPQAALQAQAILARTLALPFLRPLTPWPDQTPRLQDSTTHQFYGGQTYETAATTVAVRATQAQILTHQHHPIEALFHSTCGGHTSANQSIFAPPAHPYLQGVSCSWCRESPFWGPHSVELSVQDCAEIFGPGEIKVTSRDPHGRPLQIQVGQQPWMGQDFWLTLGQHLGWGLLPGNRFQIQPRQPEERVYRVIYQGAGHGVGLCQWGARGLAAVGRTVQDILQYYYPGTEIHPISTSRS